MNRFLKAYDSEDTIAFDYKAELKRHFPISELMHIPSTKIETDGILYVKKNNLIILMEFKCCKYKFKLEKILYRCLIQVLFYLKRIEIKGLHYPTIILIGNEVDCYCFHFDKISKYLDKDLEWSICPTKSWLDDKSKKIMNEMKTDSDLKFLNYNVTTIDFKKIIDDILSINHSTERKVTINKTNIERFFIEFVNKVLKDEKKFDSNQIVSIFLNLINDPDNNYLHPNIKNILVSNSFGNVKIDGKEYESFFNHVTEYYTPKVKDEFVEISDRLIEELNRRRKGEFYTPTIWCNEAHELITTTVGENWKNDYVVWDPSWGTGNLTRDYSFINLFASTLNSSDIDIANSRNYNPEAVKFTYDFLNDDVYDPDFLTTENLLMPELLISKLLENSPIMFFMNPPYLTVSGVGYGEKQRSVVCSEFKGATKNRVKGLMNKFGQAGSQLYIQFLYRIILLKKIYNLTNVKICIFHPTILFSGSSYMEFRKLFFKGFKLDRTFMFNAGEFSSVSSNWAISFSIFSTGPQENATRFTSDIKETKKEIIDSIGNKIIYNNDDDKLLNVKWISNEIIGRKKIDVPFVSNPINIRNIGEGKMCEGAFGFFLGGNSCRYNNNLVSIFTSAFTSGGISIIKENYMKIFANFTARKTIKTNWINDKDEYCIPNTAHDEYEQWNNDCVVYSLFNSSSNQSSLRNITFKKKIWNIENEFFWMSNEEIRNLANNTGTDIVYRDTIVFNKDRLIFKKLNTLNLSQDAQLILQMASELVIKSFPYRNELNQLYPEWNLNSWDAGWYQIRLILKTFLKEELEKFNELYSVFGDRMKEGVYKFNFLKE